MSKRKDIIEKDFLKELEIINKNFIVGDEVINDIFGYDETPENINRKCYHQVIDSLYIRFIRELGYKDIAEEFKKAQKWFYYY